SVSFGGIAEGSITNSSVLVNLQGTYEVLTSSPEPRSLVVELKVDLSVVDNNGASKDAILDTFFNFMTNESMIFPFDGKFNFDLSDFLGFRVTGVSGLVSASTSSFSGDDMITLSIPDSSLDFGVAQGNAVPEPSGLALLGIGVAVMLVGGLPHRTGQRKRRLT